MDSELELAAIKSRFRVGLLLFQEKFREATEKFGQNI